MSPEFWQYFLAAEFPTAKSRVLLQELGFGASNPIDRLSKHRLLSPMEKERMGWVEDGNALSAGIANGVRAVESSDFSEYLRVTSEWPALFAWGDFGCSHRPTVSIVGTRDASAYGKAAAQKFAEAFARAGVTVVSGGAVGIDAAAHKGALAADGSTIAVLAGGVDDVYPAVHGGLFTQIRQRGCLVSQFAVGRKSNRYKFILRNRLVAALSQATLVIEAPHKSGALTTALAANDFGRQVFVVPANIDNPNFSGSHTLIRDGAALVDHPDQVLQALGIEPGVAPLQDELREESLGVIDHLNSSPTQIEALVDKTGWAIDRLLSELTMLEMEGRVNRSEGGYILVF